jgi:hypothetical protein
MAEKNGTNGVEAKRKPFKKGEREKHLELLAKNYLLLEDTKEKVKRVTKTIERVAEDIRQNGYADDDQGSLPMGSDDELEEARA